MTIVQQIFTGSRWVILLNGLQTIVQQISTASCWVILLNGFQTIVQQIHRESLVYSSQRVHDYCPVDSEGVAWLYSSTGCRLLSSRFTGSRWVILLNGFQTIVQQIHRESLGYSSKRVPDYCQVDSQGVAGLFFSKCSRILSSRYSQGVAGIFFSTDSRLLSSRDSQGVVGFFFSTGSRLLPSRFTGSRWVIFLNGFNTIVQQLNRESLGYSSQRILDYCPVDIHRESLGYSSQRVLDYCQQIHRESPGYSSQRVLDYCSVDSQGAAGLFFSMGSRQLSSRFTGSRWVILLNGFQTIVQQRFTGSRWVFFLNGFQTIAKQIHREPLGYSSQWVQDNCPVDSQGVVGLFFSTGSRLLSSRFTGSRRVILLSGFQTIVQQIHWESLGYSSQQVLDYCPVEIHRESLGFFSQRILDYCRVDSQGAAGLFFSMGSRQLSSRFTGSRWVILLNGFLTIVQQIFTGSRWVILLNGFQTIVQQIHRESPGYSSQRVLDYCSVDSLGVAGLFFSTGSRLLYSRLSGSRWVILLNGFYTIVQQIFTGSRCVILLNGFQTIVQQIHRESLGYSSQRVLDYCQVDSQGVAGLFFSTGSRQLSSRFTGSRWVILPNGFQAIVQQIHRESLVYSSQRFLDYCPVEIHRETLGYSSKRVLDYCPVDIYRESLVILLNGFQTIVSRFTGSRRVILLSGFQTIVQQIHREPLGYSSQWVQDNCPVDSQGVAGLFFSTDS